MLSCTPDASPATEKRAPHKSKPEPLRPLAPGLHILACRKLLFVDALVDAAVLQASVLVPIEDPPLHPPLDPDASACFQGLLDAH